MHVYVEKGFHKLLQTSGTLPAAQGIACSAVAIRLRQGFAGQEAMADRPKHRAAVPCVALAK